MKYNVKFTQNSLSPSNVSVTYIDYFDIEIGFPIVNHNITLCTRNNVSQQYILNNSQIYKYGVDVDLNKKLNANLVYIWAQNDSQYFASHKPGKGDLIVLNSNAGSGNYDIPYNATLDYSSNFSVYGTQGPIYKLYANGFRPSNYNRNSNQRIRCNNSGVILIVDSDELYSNVGMYFDVTPLASGRFE